MRTRNANEKLIYPFLYINLAKYFLTTRECAVDKNKAFLYVVDRRVIITFWRTFFFSSAKNHFFKIFLIFLLVGG